MPLINKTGKSKGFAFIVTPEKVHKDLLLGTKLLIKEATSTKKKYPYRTRDLLLLQIIFQKINIYSNDPELYLATCSMRQPSVSVKTTQHMKNVITQDNYKERNSL